MKLAHCLKLPAIVGATLAVFVAAQARSWGPGDLAKDNNGNLITASYYPSSTKLRVSKRDPANTNGLIWCHDITPPTGYKINGGQAIRTDGAGNIFVGTVIFSASANLSKYVIYKLSPSGSLSATAIYAPNTAGQSAGLTGMTLDSSGNVYLVGIYGATSAGFIVKYTSSLVGVAARQVPNTGINNYTVDDLVSDGSGNVYVSASGLNASSQVDASICKWDSTFATTPVWQRIYSLPASAAVAANYSGSMVIDSSNNLTYVGMYADANNSFQSNIYAVQYTSAGIKNWDTQPNLPGSSSYWTILDSNGDIVDVSTTQGGVYQVAKFNGSTGNLAWSTSRSVSLLKPTMCQDASGDYLVVYYQSGSTTTTYVDRFTGSTGAYSTTYSYSSGPGGQDYGSMILPGSTTGTYFVFGVGLSGGTYYPLIYGRGANTWTVYQTMLIP